ncbi:unnamed protein product [Pedinophyceae sp. YPF-701]|nr:unnamed protein product [Pedinophyceae sp. YPF-701]
MKLLLHNLLECNIKGVENGYPLKIEARKVEVKEADFQADFLKRMLQRLDWSALVQGAKAMGVPDLPEQYRPEMADDEAFLRALHHALLEVHLEEGALICPESGRRFEVKDGVPNMKLAEDEV